MGFESSNQPLSLAESVALVPSQTQFSAEKGIILDPVFAAKINLVSRLIRSQSRRGGCRSTIDAQEVFAAFPSRSPAAYSPLIPPNSISQPMDVI